VSPNPTRLVLGALAGAAIVLGAGAADAQGRGRARHLERRAPADPADTRVLSGPREGDALDIAMDWLQAHKEEMGLVAADLADVVVASRDLSEHSGVTHLYLRQRFRGIDVHGADVGVHVARDGSVIAVTGTFVPNLGAAIRGLAPARSAVQSAQSAAEHLGLPVKSPILAMRRNGGASDDTMLSDGGISRKPIPARLVYEPTESGEVALAWLVEIEEMGSDHWWAMTVDAETGETLEKKDYTIYDSWDSEGAQSGGNQGGASGGAAALSSTPFQHAYVGVPGTGTYRAIGWPHGDPNDGDRLLVVDPAHPTSSPFGWHDTDGVSGAESTNTTGNNVDTYTDINNNNNGNAPDSRASGGASLNFDFPLDLNINPKDYRPAALTNLFYWNNVMHDLSYLYGFTESAGNFQNNQYGRGPTVAPFGANDRVNAEAQDGGGMNNANFSTGNDGSSPRMQMYLWVPQGAYQVQVTSGPVGNYATVRANFGAFLSDSFVTQPTAQVVLATPNNGCAALTGFPAGAIAYVDSGTCNNVVKAQNAQAAGAVGMIVNSGASDANIAILTGVTPVDAAGNATLTIPVLGISTNTAATLRPQLPFTAKMAFLGTPAPLRDGDLDNTVIGHEYTHGISNRLTGGRTNPNCLNGNEQMGEGWSDWVGMAFSHDPDRPISRTRGLGPYIRFTGVEGPGIRATPYSTDMTINPSTYNSVKTAVIPHGVGYVWATELWEVYWNLIDKHGFNPDVYEPWNTGGNNLAIQLVFDGMKMQPCNPGFVTGRNAILQADEALTGGENQCAIWHGFAKRGLGNGASQGSVNSVQDGIENFDLPPLCQAGITLDPLALSATQECSTTTSHALALHNTSAVDGTALTWSIADTAGAGSCASPVDLPWLAAAPASGLTAPGANSTVAVGVDSTTLDVGSYSGKVCVASNAEGSPREVPVTVNVFDNTPPTITAPPPLALNADAAFCGAVVPDVTLGTATASDNCAAGATIDRTGVPAGNVFPVGTTVVTYTATDAVGKTAAATQTVSITDATAPVIGGAAPSPSRLWPPNHKMVDVVVAYTAADNCGAVTTSLSVSSNEVPNGSGDGNTSLDWQVVDNHHVRLRAERAGGGNGRIYTITIHATDTHGNTSSQSVIVLVPHSG